MPLSRSLDLLAHPNYPTMSSDVAMETSSSSYSTSAASAASRWQHQQSFSLECSTLQTSPGVDYALTDTMTQLSLLLAWKLSVYLAPHLKLELSTWGINLAGSLNRYLPSHTNWTQHTHVHKYCADVKEE